MLSSLFITLSKSFNGKQFHKLVWVIFLVTCLLMFSQDTYIWKLTNMSCRKLPLDLVIPRLFNHFISSSLNHHHNIRVSTKTLPRTILIVPPLLALLERQKWRHKMMRQRLVSESRYHYPVRKGIRRSPNQVEETCWNVQGRWLGKATMISKIHHLKMTQHVLPSFLCPKDCGCCFRCTTLPWKVNRINSR